MSIQAKKSFAAIDYTKCSPQKCDQVNGICPAIYACSQKIIKQIDGPFEPPAIFNDLCMGCWDCIESCPMEAIYVKQIS